MWNYREMKKANLMVTTLFILFIFGVIFPWRYAFGDGYFSHHRIVQLIFLVLVSISLVSGIWRATVMQREESWLKLGAALFYAGGLLSVFMAISVPQAGLEYLHWILLGVLFLSCAGISSDPYIQPLITTFLVVHGILIFLAILYLIFALFEGDPLTADVIYPATENIRFFNQVQVFVLPLLLLLLKHPRVGVPAFILFIANILLLCIGGARGAVVAIAVVLSFAAFVFPLLRGHIVRAFIASVLAVVVYTILWWMAADGLSDISRSGTSGRFDMWLEIIKNIQLHHLLWGIGPANYVLFGQQFTFGHPHNSVLQWILEWGGVSFLGASLIVGRILCKAILHLKRAPDDIFSTGLLLSWLAALVYSLVDGVIVMPIAQTLFIVFAGLLWKRVSIKTASTTGAECLPNPVHITKSCITGLLVLLITVPYIYFASKYYVQQTSTHSNINGPRFWINGTPLILTE